MQHPYSRNVFGQRQLGRYTYTRNVESPGWAPTRNSTGHEGAPAWTAKSQSQVNSQTAQSSLMDQYPPLVPLPTDQGIAPAGQ